MPKTLTEQGLKDEARVISYLKNEYGLLLNPSSKTENIYSDIDCWAEGEKIWDLIGVKPPTSFLNYSISIKAQHTAAKTKNLCFELAVAVESNRWDYYDKVLDRKLLWKESTWYEKVDIYIILVEKHVFAIPKRRFSEYIEENGWDWIRFLSPQTQKLQLKRGHSHLNARLGLISGRKLLDEAIMFRLGSIN